VKDLMKRFLDEAQPTPHQAEVAWRVIESRVREPSRRSRRWRFAVALSATAAVATGILWWRAPSSPPPIEIYVARTGDPGSALELVIAEAK
jgi:hypothetical protein